MKDSLLPHSTGSDITPQSKPPFEAFYAQERLRSRGWILKTFQCSETEADELVDRVFAKVWQHWNAIDAPEAYLYRVLQSALRDHFRNRRREKSALEKYVKYLIQRDLEQHIRAEEEQIIARLLERAQHVLTTRELRLLKLYCQYANLQEAAQQEGISYSYTRQVWSKIRTKLQKIWRMEHKGTKGF